MQPLFLFKVLGIPFFSYTTCIVSGVMLALAVALVIARRRPQGAAAVAEGFAWIVLPALLLGRAAHLQYNANYYVERPGELLRFADGGLALVGLVGGGSLGLWCWCRQKHYSFAQVLGNAALPLCIVAAFAWLGAFLHGSQYGAARDDWFALELRDTFGVVSPRWPTQLAAALWSAALGLVLAARMLWPRDLIDQRTQITRSNADSQEHRYGILCLIGYAAGMFALDFTRGDASPMVAGLRLTQCLYLVLCALGILHMARTSILRIGRNSTLA